MQLFYKIGFLLAFGNGSEDTLEVAQVRQRVTDRIDAVCRVHPLDAKSRQALVDDLNEQIKLNTENGRVRVRALPSLLNPIERKAVFGINNLSGYVALPDQLKLPSLFHLESFYQRDGWTCGYRALFNARAIQTCLETGNLTAEAIADEMVKYLPNVDASLHYPRRDRSENRLGFKKIELGNQLEFNQIMEVNSRLLKYGLDDKSEPGLRALNNVYVLATSPEVDDQIWLENHRDNLGDLNNIIDRGLQAEWGNQYNIRPVDLINELTAYPRRGDIATLEEIENARRNSIATTEELLRRNTAARTQAYIDMQAELRQISNNINNAPVGASAAAHFICNLNAPRIIKIGDEEVTLKLGFHWILISIVKRPNRGPVMIIMDSKNWESGPTVTEFAHFLYNIFINRNAVPAPVAAAAAQLAGAGANAGAGAGRLSPNSAASKEGR